MSSSVLRTIVRRLPFSKAPNFIVTQSQYILSATISIRTRMFSTSGYLRAKSDSEDEETRERKARAISKSIQSNISLVDMLTTDIGSKVARELEKQGLSDTKCYQEFRRTRVFAMLASITITYFVYRLGWLDDVLGGKLETLEKDKFEEQHGDSS